MKTGQFFLGAVLFACSIGLGQTGAAAFPFSAPMKSIRAAFELIESVGIPESAGT